jgi:hypothetical protein
MAAEILIIDNAMKKIAILVGGKTILRNFASVEKLLISTNNLSQVQ